MLTIFKSYPAEWEWVALILGGLGFLMAMQPFIQAFIQPKIDIRLDTYSPNIYVKQFRCYVDNLPLKAKIARVLRLRRPSAISVSAAISIKEKGSGKVLIENLPLEWHLQQPGYLPDQIDIHAISGNAYLTFGVKYNGVESIEICDAAFTSGQELEALNTALKEGDVSKAFRHPLGKGTYQFKIALFGQGVLCAITRDLHNDGPNLNDTWVSSR